MKLKNLIIIFLGFISISGCLNYRTAVREFGRTLGAIQIRDIQEADFVNINLPQYLGLNNKDILVKPYSKTTLVKIDKVDTIDDRLKIKYKISSFIFNTNPKIKPIELTFSACKNLKLEKIIIKGNDEEKAKFKESPKGFSWRYFKKVKAYFLVPDNWYIKEELEGNTVAIFITKESIENGGIYKVGFSANIMSNLSEKYGNDAYKFTKTMFENMEKSGLKVENLQKAGDGKYFAGYRADVTSKNNEGKFFYQSNVHLFNLKTRTLYICIIEAPLSEWENEKLTLNTIMMDLGLDTEY